MEKSTQVELFESVEDLIRAHVRDFVEEIVEDELTQVLERDRYGRGGCGYRNGHRERTLTTTMGELEVRVPRARIFDGQGEREFGTRILPKGKRLTANAEALIVATYLCGVSMRKNSLALAQALGSGVTKSTVSRCLARLRPAWISWQTRDLTEEGIVRLVLDGIVVNVRVDRKKERMTVLVALGVRADGQKVILAFRAMGAESKEAWKELLEDLSSRGVKSPQVVSTDGSKGLEAALAEVWPQAPVQRCTVHKERNLLAQAPESLHEELKEDYKQMIYADTADEVLERRLAFLAKWRSKCPGVARSLNEAGDRLFTFLRFPPIQWRSLRTTNCVERIQEEFRRRVKVQGVQPNTESVLMLFWALMASGAVVMRKVDGYETLQEEPKEPITLAA
jgi:putative transposase